MENKGIILTTVSELEAFSEKIARSESLLPKHIQQKKAEQRAWDIMAAIQMGSELGLAPMASIHSIAVVNGVPTIYGDMMLGIVRASGLCEYIIEEIKGDADTLIAVCKTKRKGDPNEVVSEFSVLDAKKAGLWGKAGPWSTHPKRMLKYKARAFALRDVYPDVLKGLHATEEMEGESLDTKGVMASANIQEPTQLSESEQSAIMKEVMDVIDSAELDGFQVKVRAALDKYLGVLTPRQDQQLRQYANDTYKKLKEFEKLDTTGIVEFKPKSEEFNS